MVEPLGVTLRDTLWLALGLGVLDAVREPLRPLLWLEVGVPDGDVDGVHVDDGVALGGA